MQTLGKNLIAMLTPALDQRSAISVISSILNSEFKLSIVPRFVGTEIRYEVIQDCGIRDPGTEPDTLTAKDILSYSEYCAQKRPGAINMVSCQWSGNAGTGYITWMKLGYDSSGKAVKELVTMEKINESLNSVNNLPELATSLGRAAIIRLPAWLMNSGAQENYRKKIAESLILTQIASGGGFSGSSAVTCPVTVYDRVKNNVGKVMKIDCTGAEFEKSKGVRFGRLIGVEYRLSASANELTSTLLLSFDCVLSEDDFDVFKVSADDLLCIPSGRKK